MKYQLIQHLKTKSKVLTVWDKLQDCINFAKQEAIVFVDFNYIGGFPIFNGNNKVYSIQGLVDGLNIVCSLSDGDRQAIAHAKSKE